VSDLTFVLSRAHALDEVEYLISIYRSPEGFLAFWECPLCSDQDRLPVATADRDAAIKKCQTLIEQHHTHHHAPVKA
jgi:hypothetical protein